MNEAENNENKTEISKDDRVYKCVRDTVYSPIEYEADWQNDGGESE